MLSYLVFAPNCSTGNLEAGICGILYSRSSPSCPPRTTHLPGVSTLYWTGTGLMLGSGAGNQGGEIRPRKTFLKSQKHNPALVKGLLPQAMI